MNIREATIQDAPSIAKVHIDSWRTTYQGIIPNHFFFVLSYERSENMWRDIISKSPTSGFTFVAELEKGNIVGFANGGPEREDNPEYTGEIYAIYLLKEFQRMGIGRLLTAALVNRLIQIGLCSQLGWVLEMNPARRFYEALGGKIVSQKVINIGGNDLTVVSYGWRDAHTLLLYKSTQ